jgi:hypothetical protein
MALNHIENKFSVKRIKKSTDSDYISALKIYNETTPIDIRTNSNEITYWIDQPNNLSASFEMMVFVLCLDEIPIGFAMMGYIRRTKIITLDYLSVYEKYRINAVLFPYLSLLQNYLNNNGYDVAYIVNEVSNKNKGISVNKESKMFKKLFCLEGFGRVDAIYYTPPLGLNNYESIFDAHLYIKSNDNITIISKMTFLSIVESIYKDWFTAWYLPFFVDESEKNQYVSQIDQVIAKIERVAVDEHINVLYMECPILIGYREERMAGVLPIPPKKRFIPVLPLIIALIIICPVFVIWLYTYVLNLFGIPLDAVNTAIGTVVSATITSVSAILIARKKS